MRVLYAGLPVDILGFIFYAPSKRDISAFGEDEKEKLLLQTDTEKAGVFVNERNWMLLKKYAT